MKRCPECRRDYTNETLNYCLDDGAELVEGPISPEEASTAILSDPGAKKSLVGATSDDPAQGDLSQNVNAVQTSTSGTQSSARSLRGPYILVAALLLILASAGGFGAWYFGFRSAQTATRNTRFPIVISDGAVPYADVETHSLSISPDARFVAFIATSKGERAIWIRPLDNLDAHALPGTENAQSIFWSPDSTNIAFFAGGKLKRIEASGKSLQTVCDMPAIGDASGSWGSRGTIVFFQDADRKFYSVTAAGGSPVLVAEKETGRFVRFLPDGQRFIFVGDHDKGELSGVYAGSIDSNETKQIAKMTPARAQYVNGFLIYPKDGSLVAQPFDQKTLTLSGEPTVIVERLPYFDKTGWAEFSASESGTLVYMTEFPKSRIVWLDRKGVEISQVGAAGNYAQVRLSPDGQRVVVHVTDPRILSGDIWIIDLSHNTSTVFVSGPTDDGTAFWSPDGRQIAYFSCCGVDEPSTLHIKDVSGTENVKVPQLTDQHFVVPEDWSPDGKSLIYDHNGLWILPVTGLSPIH